MSIERKFKMALDETRMLMLGAQILFGFQFNAVFHEGFEDLPQTSRGLDAVSLMLIALSITLLIAPGTQHRLTDNGQITGRLRRAITMFAGLALLPFACALGLDIYIALSKVLGPAMGLTGGALVGALAILF